ncbi:DUF3365 domain-containing protein [Leptospira sp. WS39.C2]
MKIGYIVLLILFFLQCQESTTNYESLAISIATEAKANLQKTLISKITEGGTKLAIPFCHENAMLFSENLGKKNGVNLKRITDKPRNPKNALSLEESEIFLDIQKRKTLDGVFPNQLISSDQTVTVYIPIVMMGQCLQCHGKPGEISKETQTILGKLYPNDKAIGYEVGQLRGLFSVRFQK